MAFNWTTTTILNSLEDYSTGLPLIKVWGGAVADGAQVYENLTNPKGPAGFSGPYPTIKIKRDFTFESRYISSVYKAEANNPIRCKMEIDCSAIKDVVTAKVTDIADLKYPVQGRLAFYVGLEGSEESIYANDWYQKGKPFSIGFEVSSSADSADDIAKSIEKNAKKYGINIYGKQIFEIENNSGTITLTGTHEYQRFKTAAIALDCGIDEIIADYFEDGVDAVGDATKYGVFTSVERGVNGFGTYSQLVKDLRLPTAHNIKWLRTKQDETPIVGAKYNQYIITYCAPSMANPGFTVIGQHNNSVTTHVFWVNQSIDDAFETELEKVATIIPVNKVTSEGGTETTITVGAVDTKVEMTDSEGTVIADNKVKAEAAAGTKYSVNHAQNVAHSEVDADDTSVVKEKK